MFASWAYSAWGAALRAASSQRTCATRLIYSLRSVRIGLSRRPPRGSGSGQIDLERGAGAQRAVDREATLVLIEDLLRDQQPQPHAYASAFGGEAGVAE